jgi:adenylosuccinate lyase
MSYFNTLSPLDNRYNNQIESVIKIFNLFNQIKTKATIEIKYFLELLKFLQKNNEYLDEDLQINKSLNIDETFEPLYTRIINMNENDLNQILEFEKECHHDIKSIEYWIKYNYDILYSNNKELYNYKELIHFGLTSQDINNTAFDINLEQSTKLIINKLEDLQILLNNKSVSWHDTIMLGYTHGQPAVPTSLGKEFNVFQERLNYNIEKLKSIKFITKMGGAIGNLNAHICVYPNLDWDKFFKNFVNDKLNLDKWNYTTQITNYENLVDNVSIMKNVNTTLLDLCQDIWLYCHKKYFIIEKENKNQVGSSTMPQKVNPIKFENAEGNLKVANSLFTLFIEKLQISRLQRDLTDSTVLRNYGVPIGHTYLALINIIKGFNKLMSNNTIIQKDLYEHPEILAEGIQSLLRAYRIENAYDIIREATQNKNFDNESEFKTEIISILEKKNIKKFNVIKKKINDISIDNYIGNINYLNLY